MATATRRARPWIDVSVPIATGMAHWPDNPPIVVERTLDMEHGDAANVSKMSLGVHTGTHVDAPVHFDPGATAIDRMPIDATVGRARVIAIANKTAVTVEELEAARIKRGERILLRTRNSPRAWKQPGFVEDFVYLTTDAARWIAKRGVRTVGVDYLSVGGYRAGNGEAVHHALLGAGVWIIEGLDLSRVPPGACELMCLPIKVKDGDGAPARAFVRPLASKETRHGKRRA
jgi:arylformamidase